MAVEAVEILEQRPFAAGKHFGDAGPYEIVAVALTHAVDPDDPVLAGVTDLDSAPRGSGGLVRFENDLTLLRPVDPARRSSVLLELVNRGLAKSPSLLRLSDTEPGTPDPGDGFGLDAGWTYAEVGWQQDLLPGPGLAALRGPAPGGQGLSGMAEVRWEQTTRANRVELAPPLHRVHPLDEGAPDRAELAEFTADGVVDRPAGSWHLSAGPAGPVLDTSAPLLPGHRYRLRYRSVSHWITGLGPVAVRDTAAALRHGVTRAPWSPASALLGLGVSQTARMLRHMLRLGLLYDAAGRLAFDGMLVVVAGGLTGDFVRRFATTGGLPFGDEGLEGGPVDYPALLSGLAPRPVPKVIAVNSATEYWRGDAHRTHTRADGEEPQQELVRVVSVAGAQHSGAGPGRAGSLDLLGIGARYAPGVLDYRPVVRAAAAHLTSWATDGTPPPESLHPRLSDGTARSAAEVVTTMAAQGWAVPELAGARARALVADIDDCGNERGGVRLPAVRVPLARHQGWNTYSEPGASGVIPMVGAAVPFDRATLNQLYAGRDDYLGRVGEAVEELVAQGWVLPRERDLLIHTAKAEWDRTRAEGGAAQ